MDGLEHFHPTLQRWFAAVFGKPTAAQSAAWPAIARGQHTLLLAPTGSGKTLAAFLSAIDRLIFSPRPTPPGIRVLYISPLKALGVDVERNLRTPIAGVQAGAVREGVAFATPQVGIRSGDTTSAERRRLLQSPPDILITTPESLYLLLTSAARRHLRTVETIIVDEIHAMAAVKRGSHLFVSLERLEDLRRVDDPRRPAAQRIGLSATQRPLEEIAALLGGAEYDESGVHGYKPRPVEIISAGRRRALQLRIETPLEDMARPAESMATLEDASLAPIPSVWSAIHPRLVELIRQHRSTMIFVNNRRLAERLALAINEEAHEELALAHHGSIAKDTRVLIEDRLKRGALPAIVATSSLELGIDMGAVDLVIQIEAPPSVASGMQRIGRSGHQVDAVSQGVIFPKFRGDLLACSAAAERMLQAEVESTRFPRNPLDVLAQQVVAIVSMDSVNVDDVYQTLRRSAPFADLPRSSFEGVLDLLSGRYPSDEFAELRPRLNWDRLEGRLSARAGAQKLAVLNAGVIPDRGLYGVFLAADEGGGSRVGELDEEMVFETHVGDVFLLGASSWRVLEITHDRVLVAPAPGEPGRMPFWRGDGPGRPLEFGLAIGRLTRQLLAMSDEQAREKLQQEHALDSPAARNLLAYLREQQASVEEAPTDRTIVVESFLDEVGDWRVAVLTPFGARVHAPWAAAVARGLRAQGLSEVDLMWTDDGVVFRIPESDEPPPAEWFFPAASEIESQVVAELGSTALFAARFRENAARALLLPKQRPGRRTPLWLQRRRSADLLSVAAHYESFPILLETYRECLRDIFDMDGLKNILRQVEQRQIRVHSVRSTSASPFAATLMFHYVGKFLYDGDAPLAERRAAALALDHAQLRELLGDAELREMLDPAAVEELALELQRLDERRPVRGLDDLHDLLLQLGDLTASELAVRCGDSAAVRQLGGWLQELEIQRRIIQLSISGQRRYVAAEDAARYRDALGAALPQGLPSAFLEAVADPLGDLVSRFARTHTPFQAQDIAARWSLGLAPVLQTLRQLAQSQRVVEGEFLPGGHTREWCALDVLRRLKQRSLARLRKRVEPVEQEVLARFLPAWQSVSRPRKGLDGLLDVIEQLQGYAAPASVWEQELLPARVHNFQPHDLDQLCAAGEVVWRGYAPLGNDDGHISLFLADHYRLLAPQVRADDLAAPAVQPVIDLLGRRGAVFFEDLVSELGGFAPDLLQALWRLVWQGAVANDSLAALRSLRRGAAAHARRRHHGGRGFRSRRALRLPGSEGRWSLLPGWDAAGASATERQTALAQQLLQRYGVVTREMVRHEAAPGGFAGVYPIFKAMEQAGKVRRGYFVTGLGAAQFAMPGAEDRLRELRSEDGVADDVSVEVLVLAAADPANAYGLTLPWPSTPSDGLRPARAAGAKVILHQGRLLGYLSRSAGHLLSFLPSEEPQRSQCLPLLAAGLRQLSARLSGLLLHRIDQQPARQSPLLMSLKQAGFQLGAKGLLLRSAPPVSLTREPIPGSAEHGG